MAATRKGLNQHAGARNYASLTLRVRTQAQPFIAISGTLNPQGERYLD